MHRCDFIKLLPSRAGGTGFGTRHALRQPELTAMEMSGADLGADLDRLAGRALNTFRFLLTPDISQHCANWFEGPLSVKTWFAGGVVPPPGVAQPASVSPITAARPRQLFRRG
jgi:hypothetical protein